MKRIIILIIGIFVMVSCVYVPVTENTSVDYSVVRSAQKAIFFGWIAFYLFLSRYLITTDFWDKKVF